jgi:class 3 adenylate cyclase/tetratricopeptide (TPR) repeat protein
MEGTYNRAVGVTCPTCGFENLEGARFCSSCGAALAAAEAPVTAARRERKFATALFADLVGSTELAEREDPEVVQAVIGRAFDRLAAEIERYGGLLEKFMGDAVLAVFGVPHAHEDDPERAVRAGLEMQAVLNELNRGFASEGRPSLQMRVGIEAGEVLVDLERASGPRDRMLTGDAVNTAARLQTAAEPGRVVAGPAVYASTKDVIDFRELSPLALKGKARPVPAWQALRVKARRAGVRPPLGLEARLVGRDEELSVLKQTLHRVEQERRPALVTVLGNAGVGKSRLTWELQKYVEGLPQIVYWRKGRCLAYGNLSYSALAEAVKAQCEVLEDDSPDVVTEKVHRAVGELFEEPDAADVEAHVLTLVGAGPDQRFPREALFDSWRRLLERLAARYPLVLVLEDIHWADEGLLDFVDHLADWAQGAVYVVTMARPELLETRPGWGGGKRNYSAIFLDPLSREENEAMIDDLLATALPPELKRLVIERSEGNPLYTEEIVRMFIDRGVLRATDAALWEVARSVDEVEVPRSIQGLIAARLDSLPPEEKALLQDAAVVGRAFWLGAVARLGSLDAGRARELLGRLRVKEIVVPREPPTFSGELELAFRHVLIRDVAYESLPKSLRADKHVQVAGWAQERAGERSEEMAELIATHYAEALRYVRELGSPEVERRAVERDALRWAGAAGERALRLWQPREALRWFRTALDTAQGGAAGVVDVAQLWESYADACVFGAGSYDERERALQEALVGFEAVRDAPGLGRVETKLVAMAFAAGDDEAVQSHSARALGHLEPLGDSPDLAEALHWLGWFHWRRGHLEEAEPVLRRAVEVAERTVAEVTRGAALHTLGLALCNKGEATEGLGMVEESFRIARATGDLGLLARCYNNLPATLRDFAPDPARSEAILREGLTFADRAGLRESEAWLLGTLGEFVLDRGDLEEAERLQRRAVEPAREIQNPVVVGMRLGALARVLALRGATAEAEAMFREAASITRANPEPQVEAPMHVTEALVARALGDGDRELEVLHDGAAMSVGQEQNSKEDLLFELIRRLLEAGRRDEAWRWMDELTRSAAIRPVARPVDRWARALLAEDPGESAELLEAVAAELESLPRRIELARCLADLAAARARLGQDPRPDLERARDLLVECGATLYLGDVESALAAASA